MYWDREALANSEDPDRTSDKGLHCLPFAQQYLYTGSNYNSFNKSLTSVVKLHNHL